MAHFVEINWEGRILGLEVEDEHDHVAKVIGRSRTFYEAELLGDARSRLFYGKCAVDVGAHVGNHMLFFTAVMGMRTIAFEPNPESFAHLSVNVGLNNVERLSDIHRCAGVARPGRGTLRAAPASNSGLSTVVADPNGETEVVTLDDILDPEQIVDLIKIDVEGDELDVLRGATRTIARHQPLLYVEVGEETFSPVRSLLGDLGFVCWKRFNVTPTFLFMHRTRLGA